MGVGIGFKDLNSDWEGPVSLKFTLYSEHTKTVRYKCQLEKQKFDYYVPHFLLGGLDDFPKHIVVILGKSKEKMPIGFHFNKVAPIVLDQVCEYDFEEEMGHSYKYSVNLEGQKYSLYVPKEIIQNSNQPERLFTQLAEFKDSENAEFDAQVTCPHCNKSINLTVRE